MAKEAKFIIYKIFYHGEAGEYIAYVGRTKQPLNARLRGHFFKLTMHKLVDIFQVSHIETAECRTEADMFLYEIYYINKFKPEVNMDDKAPDNMTLELPDLEFGTHECSALMKKWKGMIKT